MPAMVPLAVVMLIWLGGAGGGVVGSGSDEQPMNEAIETAIA
jgi:hypothetical protein